MSTGQDGSDEPPVSYSMAGLGASLPGVAGLSASDRAGLVNVLKDKLQLLAGQPSGYIESLSPKVKRRVTVLQEIQSQHDELEARFFEEKAALEAKYQKLYEPLYNKRYGIVNGVVEVEANKDETPETDAAAPDNSSEEKGVPEFWLTAMKTNEILGMQITERDEGALKYLKDLKSSNLEDTKGFKIDFYFDENPFFKNKVLTKTYYMVDEEEPILERATGTEIEWYPGKNLTQKLLKKKPKKGAKNAKPVTKTEECESFFNFFYPPKIPEDEDDIDQDTAEQLQDLMEQDYDVGSTIKEKLIPHAVSWFTGEALQGEEFEDDEDDEDEGDEEEEDDEDEEEEDEDEEGDHRKRAAPKLKVRMKNHPPQQEAGEQPAECKQQ